MSFGKEEFLLDILGPVCITNVWFDRFCIGWCGDHRDRHGRQQVAFELIIPRYSIVYDSSLKFKRNSYKPLDYKRLSPPIVKLWQKCNNSVTLVTHLARLKPKSDLWMFQHFEIGHFNKIKQKNHWKPRISSVLKPEVTF